MQRISKYKINNRSCYGYANSVNVRLTSRPLKSVSSLIMPIV